MASNIHIDFMDIDETVAIQVTVPKALRDFAKDRGYNLSALMTLKLKEIYEVHQHVKPT